MCSRKKALKNDIGGSIISRHLSKIRSPIRPFELPHYAEMQAQAYEAAPSPSISSDRDSICRYAEIYLDIAAEIARVVLSSDSNSSHGWIGTSSDDEMST